MPDLGLQVLREHYPHNFMMNHVVWPYSSGEVAVQNYNAVLSLGRLEQCSDAIVVIENDSVHEVCARKLGAGSKVGSAVRPAPKKHQNHVLLLLLLFFLLLFFLLLFFLLCPPPWFVADFSTSRHPARAV